MHVALLICSGLCPLSITRIHHESILPKRPICLAWNGRHFLTTRGLWMDIANCVPPAPFSLHYDDRQVREGRELATTYYSGVPMNFFFGGGRGSTNSDEDRENGYLGPLAP